MTDNPKNEDEKRRDEALKRALRTPPKPHKRKRDESEREDDAKDHKDQGGGR